VAEVEGFALADVVDAGDGDRVAHGVEADRVALRREGLLQLEGVVEVVLDGPLVATGELSARRRDRPAVASSTTYWMAGLSTIGGISFGVALVAGGKRVPSSAAGTIVLRTGRRKLEISCANCLWSHTTWRRPVRDFECGCGYRR
jgi:hypothetical protein